MTGFARREVSADWGALTWEIKSVNHRYLEVATRLPESLRALEPKIREAVARRVARGKVEVSARLALATSHQAIAVDSERLGALSEALDHVRSQVIDCRAPDALALLNFPGVQQQVEPDVQRLQADAMTALDGAVDALADMRASEGQRLAEMLSNRASAIAEHARLVGDRIPEVRAELAEKWRARLAELDLEADPARLESELVIAAQRMDVAEEVDRLQSHVAALDEALGREEPVGRRLDFLMQEFNREANTIGSKSADSQVSAAAVEMKVLIEQMREQVQNIE
ncbi:YicC/YloC family endoribonuclease [Salinisphaera sp. Q1T1-3]|uniref:YicC/YloC family endoribonuclease n=1 Tax=Salinisphaera sp. Q1T1-3 TaxID=2321229 RepID=UPI0018F6CB28|nr:YicC/YloC family endoribonuclease [Salinisphaera sp. Q1T1-3]